MSQVTEIETDFAAVMQELSAQAAAAAPASEAREEGVAASGISALVSAVHALGQRVESLEDSVLRKFEALQFRKLEEQLTAIRDTETVNQKLFDSLHKELISYRDNFVRDSLQKPVIRDLLVLFDELSAIAGQFEQPATQNGDRAKNAQSRENLDNMLHFLLEILHRLEVTEIERGEKVDRTLHRIIRCVPAESAEEDGRIVSSVKRGFTWRGQVLRPEEVVVKRFP